jgi:hypothetical protein
MTSDLRLMRDDFISRHTSREWWHHIIMTSSSSSSSWRRHAAMAARDRKKRLSSSTFIPSDRTTSFGIACSSGNDAIPRSANRAA